MSRLLCALALALPLIGADAVPPAPAPEGPACTDGACQPSEACAHCPAAAECSACAPPPPSAAVPPRTDLRAAVSYRIGVRVQQMIDQVVRDGDLDRAALLAGLQDAEAGTAAPLDPAAEQQLFAQYQEQLEAKRRLEAQGQLADNAAYLAEHGKQEGVTTTASGLQYEVLKRGPAGGRSPTAKSTVRVHYVGTKRDGTVFDSSRERGEPAEFRLDGVIKGWTEGLQLMREGDVFRFTIPSELAYGAHAPPAIGPNQILIFEVELLKVLN